MIHASAKSMEIQYLLSFKPAFTVSLIAVCNPALAMHQQWGKKNANLVMRNKNHGDISISGDQVKGMPLTERIENR